MKTHTSLLLAAALGFTLTACGGGGAANTPNPTPSPTPAPAVGKSASGVVGGQPGAPSFAGKALSISGSVTQNGRAASSRDVQPGDVIRASVVSSTAKTEGGITLTAVEIEHELRGTLTRADAASGTLELFSQVVTVDALTEVFEENRDDSYSTLTLADLAVGDYVEVSGQRQSDGRVLATRVERKQPGDDDSNRSELRGPVSQLDTAARRFQIGNQRVDYAQAQLDGTLANGARVELEGQLSGNTLIASDVDVDGPAAGTRNGEAELEGPATALDTSSRRFTLQGITVDYSGASVEGQLSEGARVEVEGRYDASDATLLRASEVEVKHNRSGSGSANGEIKGLLKNVDVSGRSFEVGSSGFYADDQTVIERDDRAVGFDQLKSDEPVEVKFDSNRPLNGRSYAVKIELESDDDDGDGDDRDGQELKGLIRDFNASARSFTLNGITVQVSASTRYELDDQAGNEAAFFGTDRSGEECEVKGTLNGSVFTASKVELDD